MFVGKNTVNHNKKWIACANSTQFIPVGLAINNMIMLDTVFVGGHSAAIPLVWSGATASLMLLAVIQAFIRSLLVQLLVRDTCSS